MKTLPDSIDELTDQEPAEDDALCRYCGFDPCECDRNVDFTDYTR